MVYFISDLHLGHENMAKKRGFENADHMHQHLIESWNKVVGKRDKVFILGDISMESHKFYSILDHLNGDKEAVLGNHDRPQHIKHLLNHVTGVCGMRKYSQKTLPQVFLTHCPIHETELDYRVSFNIHGHVHENTLSDIRYINVSCEAIDYTPKTLKQLIDSTINDN